MSQPARLGFGVPDEAAADSLALTLRMHCDVVEQKTALLVHEHEHTDDLPAVVDDVRTVVANDPVVVVEHRARWRADTLDIVRVGGAHALADAGGIGGGGGAGLDAVHG